MEMREIMSRQTRKGSQTQNCASEVARISSSAMLSEAADRMKTFDVGGLPVVENNDIVGRITERDIAKAISAGMNPRTTPVRYAMASGVAHHPHEDAIGAAPGIVNDPACEEKSMKAYVTEDCISCGRCVEICPEVFELGEDIAHVKLAEIPQEYQDATQEAADECPTSAIVVER